MYNIFYSFKFSKNTILNELLRLQFFKATPLPRPREAQGRVGIGDLSWQILSILRFFWLQIILGPVLEVI